MKKYRVSFYVDDEPLEQIFNALNQKKLMQQFLRVAVSNFLVQEQCETLLNLLLQYPTTNKNKITADANKTNLQHSDKTEVCSGDNPPSTLLVKPDNTQTSTHNVTNNTLSKIFG